MGGRIRITLSSESSLSGCYYCGKPAETWDHVVPRYRNGDDTIENQVPACVQCNSSKGKKPLYEWRRDIPRYHIPVDPNFPTPAPEAVNGEVEIRFTSDDGILILEDFEEILGRVPLGQFKYAAIFRAIAEHASKTSQDENT